MDDNKLLTPIQNAFKACEINDPFLQRAILANMKKECGLVPRQENLDYSKTSNERIRSVFGTRVSSLSDLQLNEIKKSQEKFAELIYGKGNALGRSMGNLEEGDGWKYRGRGYIQLTGKNNYKFYSEMSGYDLIADPDLLINSSEISANVSILFILTGLKGLVTFVDQLEANRAVTQVIGGKALNLTIGYGAELLKKVNEYSKGF